MIYKAQDFYNYFKECYKLDYKEFIIDNILAQKYQFKWFVSKKEELISDELPIIPYNNNKVLDLEKDITLYKLEKKLFYACFFVLGKNENPLIKDKRVCAPLILFPAKIKTINDDKFLEVSSDSFVINRSVLTKLESKNDALSKDAFLNELSERILKKNLEGLNTLFNKYFSNLNTTELVLYPNVWTLDAIKKHLKETKYTEGEYKIIPAAATIFVNKSESSLRVISDLNEMAEKAVFNHSTAELLGEKEVSNTFSYSYYKSRLNTEQFKALKNAYTYSNSVIVGPPGTGKTYTITSIISDAVVKNQSVLVVSKTKQAVEVLRGMLQDDFELKDHLIHTTGARYKLNLKSKIRRYLSGITANKPVDLDESRISRLFERLEAAEERFEECVANELEKSDLDFKDSLSFMELWRKYYLKAITFDDTKIWDIFKGIEKLLLLLEIDTRSFSKRKILYNIKNNSHTFRKDIALFYDALDSNSFTKYKTILEEVNHQNILKVFPIWLANLSDLNSVLPLQKNLFDLVIIDEATQCDIASALPALYRAKRVVITGDPNQLRHYSFVSTAQQNSLLDKYNLPGDKIFDYRNRSILDLFISNVQSQDQVTFLREHFRSTPSLIEFSNQHFYDGQLKVLKSTPKHTTNKQIELIEIDGVRNEKGINEIEAKAILSKLDQLIEDASEDQFPPSIGIISPFNSQVTYIKKLLKESYKLEVLNRFNILCGTPYNFQGSEREIVLISFCVCNNTHASAFIHANKPEVLNVAITRAKSYQTVFKSVSNSKLKKESLLYQYFNFIEDFTHNNHKEIALDKFQEEVVSALELKQYDAIKCGYALAGSLLDILVTNKNKNYFIDLIGYPGMFKEAYSLERYKTLARTGVKTLPLHYSFWNSNKTEAIKRIHEFIK